MKKIIIIALLSSVPKFVMSMRVVQTINGTENGGIQEIYEGATMRYGFTKKNNQLRLGFQKNNCCLNYMKMTEKHSGFFEMVDEMEMEISKNRSCGPKYAAVFKTFAENNLEKDGIVRPKNNFFDFRKLLLGAAVGTAIYGVYKLVQYSYKIEN